VATTNLIGEYECKLDEKGRIIFPSALKKQLAPELQEKFVINRGFEGCLVIRPMDVWEEISTKVNNLSEFVPDARQFARTFNNGANVVALDSQNRFLIPKILLSHASIDTEVILFAYGNRIELWDKPTYRKTMPVSAEEYSRLAERVMGKQKNSDSTDDVP
jgi:MraZ protein